MAAYISQGVGGEQIQRGRVESQRGIGRTHKGKTDPTKISRSDRVEISEAARDLQRLDALLQRAREAYDRLPEVRRERIAQVGARLEEGAYEGRAVIEEVADLLLASGIFPLEPR